MLFRSLCGYAIFAALAIFAAAIGIRMAATQRAGTAVGTAEAAKTIEAGLGEPQTVLAGLRAASTETAEARNPYVNLKTRDQITFGSYEQDNKLSNGPEPIG